MADQSDAAGARPEPQATEGFIRTHVVLLRGVNVGGRSIPMLTLRDFLVGLGWTGVASYIQSGNLVGIPPQPSGDSSQVATGIESALAKGLGFTIPVIVLVREELATAIRDNPFASEPDPRSVHLIAFTEHRTSEQRDRLAALQSALAEQGSRDRAICCDRVVYLHTPDGFGRSKLAVAATRLPGDPVAAAGTARNWRTVRKLADLMGLPPS